MTGRAFCQLLAFLVLSGALVCISRASLRAPRSHGFYRFFAWELMLVMGLLNISAWLHAPFSWHQLISWFLLLACIIPLILGARSLIREGEPVARRETEPHLLAFEKTSSLVTSGIYRYIRHPLYSSLLFLTWGIFFKAPTWYCMILGLGATLFLVATARADEAECIRFFGQSYRDYMKRSRRFVPFLF